jgi:alkanesulfonate monooxygenase SsuD/methylene tetrahydromethanopterin reductase-like flavin-dependent oxidoreductase (luciferase family)
MASNIRLALSLPNGGECGDPRFLVELGRRAEAAGWDAVLLEDYVCYSNDPNAPATDVWPVLAALAVQTERITLGTSVTPMPRLRPWRLAREAVAVDHLSGGRLVLGVGIGDAGEALVGDASFLRFGEERNIRRRGEMTDEGLAILDGLWRGEPFSFDGQHYRVEEVTFLPRPLQRPRIPIWIGGGFPLPGPTQRALRWDGSMLYKAPQADPSGTGMTPADVRALRKQAGDRPFEIMVGGRPRGSDLAAEHDHVSALLEAGADWWMEWIPPGTRSEMVEAVERGPLDI